MPVETRPYSERKFRFWLIFGLAILVFVGAAASTGPGVTWDEPAYVAAGSEYILWLRTLSPRSVERENVYRHWRPNAEHPPAAKLVYGLAVSFEKDDALLAVLTARYGAVLMFVALVGLVYVFVAGHFGRPAGVLSALSLVLMPRVFGHGILAALDVPVALACFAATLAFSRSLGSRWRAAGAGVLWGVALLTKLNGVFLPAVLIPWALWTRKRRALVPCALFLAVGCVTFVAGWPWLWHNTVERIGRYAVNKTERLQDNQRATGTTNVPVHYLGRTYRETRAPWHYPIVMTLVTVPLGLLVLAGLGVRKSLAKKGERRRIGALILASALLHILIFTWPMVPKYDGVRLFLPAFPFIACLAGIGGAQVWLWRGRIGKAIIIGVLGLAAVALAWTHPYELSYYNSLVGGAWGANRLGFETTYWGDTVNREVMAYVNAHCPDGSTVAVWPRHQAFLDYFPWMKRGLSWDKDWRPGRPPPDFLIIFPRQGYLGETAARLVRTQTPLRQWTYLGVPQCMLFKLRN